MSDALEVLRNSILVNEIKKVVIQALPAAGGIPDIDIYIIGTLAILVLSTLYLLFNGKKKVALDNEKWIAFPLIEIEEISHDVKRFRFGLQSKSHVLGLPIGQHISLKFINKEGKEIIRSYTPTSSDDEIGYVDFVIKVYFPLEPRFPNGGEMSQHLNSLKLGDTILMRGPKGHLDYKGKGSFTIKHTAREDPKLYKMKKIGMVAGGTGITPMLQVIRAILKNPDDKTELWLIFANQTEEDILLRKELESIPKDRFHLHYTVDRPPATGWKYSSGFINEEMCKNHLPPPSEDTMLFVCGPPPMIKFACVPAFTALGFKENQWFSF